MAAINRPFSQDQETVTIYEGAIGHTYNLTPLKRCGASPNHALLGMIHLANLSATSSYDDQRRIAKAASQFYPLALRVTNLFEEAEARPEAELVDETRALFAQMTRIMQVLKENLPAAAEA